MKEIMKKLTFDYCSEKDLKRKMTKMHCNEGYAVFLTNDEKYKKDYKGRGYSGFWFGKQKNENEASNDDMYGNKGIIYDTNGNTSLMYYENGNTGKGNGTYRKLVLPPSEQVEWEK